MLEVNQEENLRKECESAIKRLEDKVDEQWEELNKLHDSLGENINRLNGKKDQLEALNKGVKE